MEGLARWRAHRRTASVLAAASLATSLSMAGSTVLTAASGAAAASPALAPSGVATFAESLYAPPDWIFPMDSLEWYYQSNVNQFQDLMWRPLYWFGNGGSPLVDPALSLADAPAYSAGGKTLTIDLKRYEWSDGSRVDARDVIFWLNMVRAEKVNWPGYVPGEFPDNVVSATAASPTSTSLTITFDAAYNREWLLYNELSDIVPMPPAWDINHLVNGQPAPPGSGGCSSMTYDANTARRCVLVWNFITDRNGTATHPVEAGDRLTYATNPLWQIVDGPWRLKSYSASTGAVAMVPNPSYSGPVKPSFAEFEEVPETSASAEYGQLRDGRLDVGWLPPSVARRAPQPGTVGLNPAALDGSYTPSLQTTWGIDYSVENFNSNGDAGEAGAIFRQLYIRQVFQHLVDQRRILSKVYGNYGYPTVGPVPAFPRTPFLSSAEERQPSYSVGWAIDTLEKHGWAVDPGGTDTCVHPALCGPGVGKGAELSLQEIYAAGSPSLQAEVGIEQRDAARAGVHISVKAEPFSQVIGTAVPCVHSQASCNWEIASWGGGWIFQPQDMPTGEYLFLTGAGANSGSYSNPTDDRLIEQTIHSNSAGVFARWENYLTDNIPLIWQPVVFTVDEAKAGVSGFVPSPYGNLTPEAWRS